MPVGLPPRAGHARAKRAGRPHHLRKVTKRQQNKQYSPLWGRKLHSVSMYTRNWHMAIFLPYSGKFVVPDNLLANLLCRTIR